MKIYTRVLMATIALFILCGAAAAQTGAISGRVQLGQPDGTVVPVGDALVEVMRVTFDKDKGQFGENRLHTPGLNAKTNKDGIFAFAGLRFDMYLVCVSAPNVKAVCDLRRISKEEAEDSIVFNVGTGDGRRRSDEENGVFVTEIRGESQFSKLNTEGFMGIRYGASAAEARKIIAARKIGTINEERSYKDAIWVVNARTDYDVSYYKNNFKDDKMDIYLYFVDDKFYYALLFFPKLDDNKPKVLWTAFRDIKDEMNRLYYPSDERLEDDDEDYIQVYEFKQAQGKPNYIRVFQDSGFGDRVGLAFYNGSLSEVAEQKKKIRKSAELNYTKATALVREKNFESAVTEYTNALKLDPDYSDAYHFRGHSYVELKKYDLAVADFTAALKYDPDNAKLMFDRAYAYAANNKLDSALADINKAIKIKANDAKFYLLRAGIFCAQGKKALAAADEKDAASLGGTVTQKCQ